MSVLVPLVAAIAHAGALFALAAPADRAQAGAGDRSGNAGAAARLAR